MIFSVWAVFALTVVNPIMNAELTGYIIGRICIWEYIAIATSVVLSFFITNRFGYPITNEKTIEMPKVYINSFLVWFVLGCIVSIWQFYLFSQKF
jgi:magnesium-transporting ATPase (P-type)